MRLTAESQRRLMTITSFLREADFAVTIFTNLAVLFFAFPAYKRTKLLAFAFLIWGGFLGIILSAALHIHRTKGFVSADDDKLFYEFYRVGYIVVSVFWTVGVVMLIRRFMAMIDEKADNST